MELSMLEIQARLGQKDLQVMWYEKEVLRLAAALAEKEAELAKCQNPAA